MNRRHTRIILWIIRSCPSLRCPRRLSICPSFIYNKEAARKLETLLQKEKPDVAHIHLMFNSMSVSILPVLRKYNIPVVMSVHDYRLVCPCIYIYRW